jgi:D-ribose pyranase
VKRSGLLHAELLGHLARLGHTDLVVVADRGLPLPPGVPVVDLALVPGVVDLRTVLDAVLDEGVVQAHTIAAEAAGGDFPLWLDARAHALGERRLVSHDDLKAMLPSVRLAVRTGEETPYANVILESGVPFG